MRQVNPRSDENNFHLLQLPHLEPNHADDHPAQILDFETVATSITIWLLPWLALTAQLPYETRGLRANLQSLLLAIGSPALITFSLSMTVLNQRWVRKRFSGLKKRINSSIGTNAPHLKTSVDAARYLLREGQQAPLRCPDSNLVVLPQYEKWWEEAKKDLQKTKRSVTFPLVAQLLFATLTFIFTLDEAFPNSGSLPTQPKCLPVASGLGWFLYVGAGYLSELKAKLALSRRAEGPWKRQQPRPRRN
jgi:hypothetical protein